MSSASELPRASLVLPRIIANIPSLMALLELCEVPYFGCDRLVVAIDRNEDSASLMKDLGWIGFGLATLDDFVNDDDMDAEVTSGQWLFMEMET